MKIAITDISPDEWKALGIKDYGEPLRIGNATVRVVRGNAHRDVRQRTDWKRGTVDIEYGPHSTMEMEVELVLPPAMRPEWRAAVDLALATWTVDPTVQLHVPRAEGAAEVAYLMERVDPLRGSMTRAQFFGLTGLEPPP